MLSGLCGDYDNNPNDDLKLITTGGITTSPVEFGNQWKLDRNVRIDYSPELILFFSKCPDVPPVINDCEITQQAIDQCISLTNQSNIFQSCFEKVIKFLMITTIKKYSSIFFLFLFIRSIQPISIIHV